MKEGVAASARLTAKGKQGLKAPSFLRRGLGEVLKAGDGLFGYCQAYS